MNRNMRTKNGSTVAKVAPLIFGFAFTGLGGYFMWSSVSTVGFRAALTDPVFLVAGCVTVLSLFPNLYIFWRWGMGAETDAEASSQAPMGQWTTRDEWRTDVMSADTSMSPFLVVFAVVWNLIAWPIAYLVLTGAIVGSGNPWLVVLFPLVGIAVAVAAAWPKVKALKYGVTRLKLETMPGRFGHPLNAVFRTKIDSANRPEQGFTVHLTCYRRYIFYSRGADGESRKEVGRDVKWNDEKTIRPRVGADNKLEIPVSFQVPTGLPESSVDKTEERMVWSLSATAEAPGIDFSVEFEIPVFAPEKERWDDEFATPVDAAAEDAFGPEVEDAYASYEMDGDVQEPVSEGIHMRRTAADGVVFDFEVSRRLTPIVIAAAFGIALFGGGVAGVIYGSFFLGLLLAAFGAVLLYATRSIGIRTSTITVEDGRVAIESNMNGSESSQSFPAAHLMDVFVEIYGQSGSDYWYALKAYAAAPDAVPDRLEGPEAQEEIQAHLEEHVDPILVAHRIDNKQEAEWIGEQILEAAEREAPFS